MQKFVNAFILSAICLPLCIGQVGCATVASNLPIVIAAVMDAELILSSIQSFVDAFFKVKPDAALEKKVQEAMARTRSALNVALRLAQGAQKLDQAKIDEAFADFKVAYAELIAVLAPLGVTMSGNTLKTIPGGGLVVPEPLAITLKVR